MEIIIIRKTDWYYEGLVTLARQLMVYKIIFDKELNILYFSLS